MGRYWTVKHVPARYGWTLLIAALVSFAASTAANATIFGEDNRHPIQTLDENDPLRKLARPIGQLALRYKDGQTGVCTAALISPTYVLTAAFCVDPMNAPQGARVSGGSASSELESATLQFGIVNPMVPPSGYVVRTEPVEVNSEIGYAVLEVEGNPAKDFGKVKLYVREPQPHQKLVLVQATPTEAISWLTVANACEIQVDTSEDGGFAHDCDTEPGSSGALVFTYSDADEEFLVIGVHSGGRLGGFNFGVPMSRIASVSPIISALAFIRAAPVIAGSGPSFSVSIAADISPALKPNITVKLNGKDRKIANVDTEKHLLTFLGDDSALLEGLNLLQSDALAFKFWNEEKVLSAFDEPYKSSYAIIAAIDDYDREAAPALGKSGYPELDGMVARAEELKAVLMRSGFPDDHIVMLTNEQATTTALNAALGEFWEGGKYADADRLFFYFGGHGDGREGNGFLVTYDIDRKRPTWTGFLMSDFIGRHFANVKARHVLVALDSCSSGLALPKTLGDETNPERLARFATLAVIRSNTEKPARNMLVAGTGEQAALAKTGGIFTHALIEGLKAEADLNKDGVIQFAELSLFVEKQVVARASEVGVRQDPRAFAANNFGDGRVLFMLPARQ